jgi:hypothetical protein
LLLPILRLLLALLLQHHQQQLNTQALHTAFCRTSHAPALCCLAAQLLLLPSIACLPLQALLPFALTTPEPHLWCLRRLV